MNTRRNDLSDAASYAMHVAAKQNANLGKMSAYARYILFIINAAFSAFGLIATTACVVLAHENGSIQWRTRSVVLAAITIACVATAFYFAAPLRANLVIFDLFRESRGEHLSLDQILGMAYDYAEIAEMHESIPRLVEEHARLKAENEKLARQLSDKEAHLANIDSRIAIDLAYDACRCEGEVDPTDIIGQLDQYALEASSAREAFQALNAARDKGGLVPYIYKSADGHIRPVLASWFDFEDEKGESGRGVVFYDTRGRSISHDDLMSTNANDWRLVQGKWVYCSPDNRFTGYAKDNPRNSWISIDDPLKLWLDNGIAAASELDFNYDVVLKRLADDWQEKRRRWYDVIKANSTPDLPTTIDQE